MLMLRDEHPDDDERSQSKIEREKGAQCQSKLYWPALVAVRILLT